jgi:hypothetical protein
MVAHRTVGSMLQTYFRLIVVLPKSCRLLIQYCTVSGTDDVRPVNICPVYKHAQWVTFSWNSYDQSVGYSDPAQTVS